LTTIPQFLTIRFDNSTKTIAQGLFLTGYVVVLLPVILYSDSVAIYGMFDVAKLLIVPQFTAIAICIWGVVIVLIVVFIYIYFSK